MPSLELLVPSWFELAGWMGVFLASLAMIGWGRLITAGRATPEAALMAGWGAAVFILTLWGLVTTTSLRLPAWSLMGIGLGVQLCPQLRLGRREWTALGRVIVIGLPLMLVMASARPSLPDTWLNLLPNAAYIYDHGYFPADARPSAHSYIAGAPYNMQLLALIASLVTHGFPASAMIDLNILLQLAAALLLARLAAGRDDAPPSWSATAVGFLLALPLNPGFVPRFHLSAYSEASVTVSLAFAGWLAARALDREDGGRDARLDLWLFAWILVALVNIKQEAIMLVASLVAAALVLALLLAVDKARVFAALAAAAIPAFALYLLWRWYVLAHFEFGELKNLPIEQWHVLELPLILWNMARAAGGRFFLFLCVAAVAIVALRRLRRREIDLGLRLAAMLSLVALFYNATLVVAYVAHFEGEMGVGAHSYFRYNTHLGLLLMAAIVVLVRGWNWSRLGGVHRDAVPAVLLAAALILPLPFLRLLRFDLEPPNLRLYALAQNAAPLLAPDARLLLFLPGDTDSVAPALEGVLRYWPQRRPALDLRVVADLGAATAETPYGRLLLSCAPNAIDGVAAGQAALLARAGEGWRAEASWSYAPVSPRAHWSQVLSPAALCLGDSTPG